MLIAGMDIGSVFTRAVIMDNGRMVANSCRPTNGNFFKTIHSVWDDVIHASNYASTEIKLIGACGLGASFIPLPFMKITDLSCLSRGVHFLLPGIHHIIEVGNQYSRVVNINDQGKVAESLASEKCASGSGRILQIISNVLGVSIEELGPLSAQSTQPAKFTTNCAVFLETEAISRVAEGIPVPDIISGLHYTLTMKIVTMASRIKMVGDCAMTGGGAMDSGLKKMIEKELKLKLHIPKEFMFTGAIGAALIGVERAGATNALNSTNRSASHFPNRLPINNMEHHIS